MSYDDMKNRIMGDLKKVFRPEFLNRIDEVIVFHKLAKEEVKEIIDLMINRVRVQVAEHELQLELTEESKDLLVDKGWDPSMGARPLRRAIQRYIEDPLADEVLRQGEMAPGLDGDGRARPVRRRGGPAAEAVDRRAEEAVAEEGPKPEPEKVGVGAKKDDGEDGERRRTSSSGDEVRGLSPRPSACASPDAARSAPGAAAASCASARRSTSSGWRRCCAPARESTPCSAPTSTGRARPTGCSAARWAVCRATTTAWSARSATTSTRASATGRSGFPRFTDPRLRGPDEYAGLPADGDRTQPRAARRRTLRPAAAPQSRPHRLLERGGLGRDGGAARGGADGADRRRARPGQRLHPRPDLLPRALRRADRLGDDHPQPVRALARRALPGRGGAPRRQGDHPGGRLRRALLGGPAAR